MHYRYIESLATIMLSSPPSIKQSTVFTKLKMSVEKSTVKSVMHEAGEVHLREEIRLRASQSRADTRCINYDTGCVVEKRTVLAELKRKRDEAEATNEAKKLKKAMNLL